MHCAKPYFGGSRPYQLGLVRPQDGFSNADMARPTPNAARKIPKDAPATSDVPDRRGTMGADGADHTDRTDLRSGARGAGTSRSRRLISRRSHPPMSSPQLQPIVPTSALIRNDTNDGQGAQCDLVTTAPSIGQA